MLVVNDVLDTNIHTRYTNKYFCFDFINENNFIIRRRECFFRVTTIRDINVQCLIYDWSIFVDHSVFRLSVGYYFLQICCLRCLCVFCICVNRKSDMDSVAFWDAIVWKVCLLGFKNFYLFLYLFFFCLCISQTTGDKKLDMRS